MPGSQGVEEKNLQAEVNPVNALRQEKSVSGSKKTILKKWKEDTIQKLAVKR